MDSVTIQKRHSVRELRHATERDEMQAKMVAKERLHTVEEFVDRLEQAIQERL